MATNEGLAVEVLYNRLSQTEPENGPAKECQDFNERVVCVSELANQHCEVPELQMSIRPGKFDSQFIVQQLEMLHAGGRPFFIIHYYTSVMISSQGEPERAAH